MTQSCPLCTSADVFLRHVYQDKNLGERPFYECKACTFIFLPSAYHLSFTDEKARYDLHQNNPDDTGYTNFLRQLTDPLSNYVKPHMKGLDYGCGPGPAMPTLLKDQNVEVQNFDPIYADDQELLKQTYDFVISTEVVEHFRKPREEFQKLCSLLKKGGILAVMTQMLEPHESFEEWWYYTEPTHISFYNSGVFDWIAQWLNLSIIFTQKNVILLRKEDHA